MRRIFAIAIGFFIMFFTINIIAWHGAKIVHPVRVDEIEQSQKAQPEAAKPEFKLPWKTFSAATEAINGEAKLLLCPNSEEESFKIMLFHDGNKYSYVALNYRWAIWLFKGNEAVFVWLGHSRPSSDDIIPTWAMPAKDAKVIFPNICSWLVQPDA